MFKYFFLIFQALFLRKLAPSLDKVMEKLIKDELFTQYNYQGIKGKKSLSSLVLFDQVLFGKICQVPSDQGKKAPGLSFKLNPQEDLFDDDKSSRGSSD